MQDRRTFIKTVSAASIAGLTIPRQLLAMNTDKVIGIQLYSIREMVNEDLEGTLAMLRDIGYRAVEAAGYANRRFYGLYPREYKKRVEDNGLMPLSTHSRTGIGEAAQTIEDALEAGMKYLVVPSIPEKNRTTIDDYKRIADEFNKIGELCKDAGLVFGYHNHDFEFKKMNGIIPYNVLLENTEPNLVTMQLDLYWIFYAGYTPTEYFEQYPGRFKLWHVKDMDDTPQMETTEVGKGIINFQHIFRNQKKAGLEYAFVEQESFKIEPEESIAISYRYLKNLSTF